MLERTIRVEERPMLALGVVTAVMSTAAFDFFHVPPVGSFVPAPSSGSGGARDLAVRRVAAQLCRGAGSVAGD
jgi:hypothetical protein